MPCCHRLPTRRLPDRGADKWGCRRRILRTARASISLSTSFTNFARSCCQNATTDCKGLEKKIQFAESPSQPANDCIGGNNIRGFAGTRRPPRKFSLWRRFALLLWVILNGSASAQTAPVTYQLPFEDGRLHGRLSGVDSRTLSIQQENIDTDQTEGLRCERWFFDSQEQREECRVVFQIPQARVFDELTASLDVRSHCPNLRLTMRIRFPHQRDLRTNQPLTIELSGPLYTDFRKWQRLECRTTEEAIRGRLIRLRGQLADGLNPAQLDLREPYVDQLSLTMTIPAGKSALQYDNLKFGPIVNPQATADVEPQTQPAAEPALTFRDDRILRRGAAFFPVFTLYHGESLDLVSGTGVNALWIPDYNDRPLLQGIAELGLGIFAQPPRPSTEQAVLNRAGLPTFGPETDGVWAWMLGFSIPASDLRYVAAWAVQVRDADRRLRRPILADVAGGERGFHREIDLLGTSRFHVHTALTPERCLEQLRLKQDRALPGKPMFTFIQTEPSAAILDARGPGEPMPVVEPEQILHQCYAAIAAGFKGIGFWKQIPLDADVPGNSERIQAMTIVSHHVKILEPWLATARVIDEIPVRIGGGDAAPGGLTGPLRSVWDQRVTPAGFQGTNGSRHVPIRAILLQSDLGFVILPVWFEEGAQDVPGPQVAKDVRFLVRGADALQAWEVTPTGISQANLGIDRVSGGTEISLKEFDRQTVIVVTTHQAEAAIEELRRTARTVRPIVAGAYVSLAAAKIERTEEVHSRLQSVAPAVPSAPSALQQARLWLKRAESDLSAGRFDDTRVASEKALQAVRGLQRAHWENAHRQEIGIVSSLDGSSFQTLPEHWTLSATLNGRVSPSGNLLPSGGFESNADLVDHWRDVSPPDVTVGLRLAAGGPEGARHLSLSLPFNPGHDQTAILIGQEIHVPGPATVVIQGKVRIPQELPPGAELAVYDTLAGRDGAVLWHRPTKDWEQFRLLRSVSGPTTMRLRVELTPAGMVELDDFSVQALR